MKSHFASFLFVLVLLGAAARTARADEPPREYVIKAAFIYNFLVFTDWPDDAFGDSKAPYIIATVGPDPFHGALERLQGKVVKNRAIKIAHYDNPAGVQKCNILFIGPDKRGELRQILEKVSPTTLTIGDFDDFTAERGMLRLYPDGTNIKFEINLEAVKQARLSVSSKLLKLAKIYGQ